MKSPAVLFYTSDFLTGVSNLTMEERGQYITILCLQHQLGHLSKKAIEINVPSCSEDVIKKFTIDDQGLYYHHRMEEEIQKREHFVETRYENGYKGGRPKKENNHMDNHKVSHMGNHIGNDNDNINISNNIIDNNKKNIKKKYGTYKRILLTDYEYSKLCLDFAKDIIDNQIEKLDEYIESNNNKNKYSNWNLVLRKSLKDNWFIKIEQFKKKETFDEILDRACKSVEERNKL